MTRSYWGSLNVAHLNRRRLLVASGGAGALLTMTLAGCGGSDKDAPSGDGASAKSSLLVLPKDTSGQAKAGGALKTFATADPPNFDPLLGGSSIVVSSAANYTYPRLLKYTTAKFPKPASGD